MILGDNIFEDNLAKFIRQFQVSTKSCFLLLKQVPDPERYGVAILKNGNIIRAVEKPKDRISDYCITGIYIYDSSVYDIIRGLKPSARGEYEITEANDVYIQQQNVEWDVLEGWWTDAGTFESYKKANDFVMLSPMKC